MSIRNIVLFVVISLLTFNSCKEKEKNTTDLAEYKTPLNLPPNILFILCDDLGYADVGFNGSTDITTPNLDQLAQDGSIFTAAYVAHPFCGPSRAALLTGRYPHTIGSQFNLPANGASTGKGITAQEQFISVPMQEAGYYTGAIGKWHLGETSEYHPNHRGFDDFYGFLGGGHKYFPEEFKKQFKRQKDEGKNPVNDYLLPLEHNGTTLQENEYLTDAFSREASRFIREAKNKNKPFFLYLAYNAPHVPLEAKKEDLDKFKHIEDKDRRTYAAMVYAIDRGVGSIVKNLKKTGQFENTLIIFLSDNGGHTGHGANNFPLTGRKGDTWEGGYRVPMFFHWPNKVPKGQKFDFPVSSLDFYPTLNYLAGATIPENKILDGKNIWEAFTSNQNPHDKETLFAMRHREGYTDVAARQNDWKAVKVHQEPWKLYNITNDISEKTDLSTEQPAILEKLVTETENWSKTHTEPLWFDPLYLEQMWNDSTMATFNQTFKISQD